MNPKDIPHTSRREAVGHLEQLVARIQTRGGAVDRVFLGRDGTTATITFAATHDQPGRAPIRLSWGGPDGWSPSVPVAPVDRGREPDQHG